MGFTYTDSDKIVIQAWGKFKVTVLEACEPGDLMSWCNSAAGGATYTVRLAAQADPGYRADCIALEAGVVGAEITACLKAELKTITTIATGGVATRVYFAEATDYLGAPVYLGEAGKPSSDEGAFYSQLIGRLVARDRLMVDMTGANVLASPTFTGTATFEGPISAEDAVTLLSTLAVTGVATLTAGAVPATDGGADLGSQALPWSKLFMKTGGAVVWGYNISFTHSTDLLTVTGGNIRMGTTCRIEFRSADNYIYSTQTGRITIVTGTYLYLSPATSLCITSDIWLTATKKILFLGGDCYINSPSTGKLVIFSTSTDASNSIVIQAGSEAGGIQIGGYLKLLSTNTDGSVDGHVWMNSSTKTLKYYGASVKEICDLQSIQTFVQYKVFGTDTKLYFRDDSYINSPATNKLHLVSTGSGVGAITLGANYGGVTIDYILRLTPTTTTCTVEGQLRYDQTTHKLMVRTASAEETVNSS